MTIVWQENDILRHLLEVGFTNAPNSRPQKPTAAAFDECGGGWAEANRITD
jgi:hypothetical protein